MSSFESIKIKGLDKNMTHKIYPDKELYNIYFKLSASAPDKWGEYFITNWQSEKDSNYKRVRVTGGHVILENCPYDMAEKFNGKLIKANSYANDMFSKYDENRSLKESENKAREEKDKKTLDDLSDKFKFD